MPIDPYDLVEEVMTRHPTVIRVFLDFRMNCVGCPIGTFHTVIDACAEHGVHLQRVPAGGTGCGERRPKQRRITKLIQVKMAVADDGKEDQRFIGDKFMTAPTAVDLEIASQIPVFSGLKSQALAVLLEKASIVNLCAGHLLFRQGETAHAFFIIMEGWIKLYRVTPAGDEAVLNVLTEGESFAEAVTFTSGRFPATACAVTPARVMVISADHVHELYSRDARHCDCDDRIDLAASASDGSADRAVDGAERHAKGGQFLASLAPCTRGPCTIALPYDKSLIAGRLGLKPKSLSRVFAKLRSIGVEVRASNVAVRDMSLLCGLLACDRIKARCPLKSRLVVPEPPRAIRPEPKPALA